MIGQMISHYKILEKLGEGGMGVVYKAEDTKLHRDVALKFLPEHIDSSEKDAARFMQEAQAAAALNHPNICTIYGIEEAGSPSTLREPQGRTEQSRSATQAPGAPSLGARHFIVMEFVDGQTLQEKKSSLSMKQALDIGIQIAEGLAAAHEKGVVHRDIKPENIMTRKDGIVQIMDFGLAKLRGASRLTKEGSTVGTAGYMSPEQVQGQDTDHRSDIFSLGVLLYEMLTGQLPFKGVHETAIAYEIVNVDSPPMSSIKPEIPQELDAIVLECLEKDPNERAQSAKQVAIDLKRYRRESSRQHVSRIMPARPLSARDTAAPSASAPTSPWSVRRLIWIVAPLIVGVAIGWLIFRLGSATAANEPRFVNVSAIAAAGQRIFTIDIPAFAFSPDGRFIAYTVTESGSTKILLRALNSFQTTPLKGTENGAAPFFSPDGKWIGFVADGKIKKVPLAGGTAESIADAPGFRGASWGPDNRIVYSPEFSAGLMSMSATGGDVRVLSQLDTTTRERTHRWPQVLPDGKTVLYTIGDQNNPNSYVDAQFALQSLETGERYILDVRGEMAVYVEPGYLVVARNGVLLAAPFSVKERRITQPLATIVNDVGGDPGSGVAHFSVSATGDLLYLPSTANRELGLVWMTREGQMTPLTLPPGLYTTPRISPDGSKLAITVGTPGSIDTDIWIYDFRTEVFTRTTFERRMSNAIWSKDGKKLYYHSGSGGLMVKLVDGGMAGTLLLANGGYPISVSPRGNRLIFNSIVPVEGNIYELDLETGEYETLVATPRFEYGGSVSPDGKYILYYSNEPGNPEVFVRTYPDLKGKWQVSRNGGQLAIWTPDGREILYINAVGRMMSVPVQRDPTFIPGVPRELFDITQMYTPNIPLANWDITPDGKRFIFIRSTNFNATVSMFNIVFNWRDELTRELSGKK